MAWRESSVVEERLRFVVAASRKEKNIAALCREFQISRETGHVWLKRYQAGGSGAVVDRSRRPLHSPARTGLYFRIVSFNSYIRALVHRRRSGIFSPIAPIPDIDNDQNP